MLVDIDKIIVGDRIRKDFGDLEELAEDIKQNGLLNALVVTPSGRGNGTYVLIAGERRLRAMRGILGYTAVPVNSVGAEDAEQALMMEISENECRKDFTKTERLEYARRLAQIESVKAKERQTSGVNDPEGGRAREKVAQALGVGDKTLRREQFIENNADLLDPTDFADWDEGKLSTNKAFQRIKAAQRQAEQERDEAEHDAAELRGKLSDLRDEVAALEKQNDELYELANTQQVVEREVVRDVVPEDYADIKRHVRELESANRLFSDESASLKKQLAEAQRKADDAGILDSAKSELAAFVWKYRQLDELADVITAAEKLLGIV